MVSEVERVIPTRSNPSPVPSVDHTRAPQEDLRRLESRTEAGFRAFSKSNHWSQGMDKCCALWRTAYCADREAFSERMADTRSSLKGLRTKTGGGFLAVEIFWCWWSLWCYWWVNWSQSQQVPVISGGFGSARSGARRPEHHRSNLSPSHHARCWDPRVWRSTFSTWGSHISIDLVRRGPCFGGLRQHIPGTWVLLLLTWLVVLHHLWESLLRTKCLQDVRWCRWNRWENGSAKVQIWLRL